jgi:hypothetical protein
MDMVGTKRERGMIRFLVKTGLGEEVGPEETEIVIKMESGEREEAGPGETGSVIRTDTVEREEAGPGQGEYRMRDIIPENVYMIIEMEESKYSRLVGEHVIRGVSLKTENVTEDKSDEVIKDWDIKDAQVIMIGEFSGERKPGEDQEPIRRVVKTEL